MSKHGWWKGLILIVVLIFVFLWMVKAEVMSYYLSSKLRVPVSISSISMWPTETKIHNFKIRNPRGFQQRNALSAKKTRLDYKFSNLIGNPSIFKEIEIEGIFLSIEFSNPLGTKNNWTAIASNMPKTKSEKEVIVDRLILKDITVEIRGLGLNTKPQTRHINEITLNHINSKKGFPTELLIQNIFQGAGIQQYIEEVFNPENIIDKFLNPFTGQNDISVEKAG